MNIFKRELIAHFKSFLVWSAVMVFLIAAGMMKYGAFARTGQAINEIFASLPPAMMTVFGVAEGVDLTSIGVFYSIFFLYFLLMISVHSTMLGASIIAKEERDQTADFLLVKPLRRRQIVTPKILAALVMIALYNQVTFVASALFVAAYNQTGQSLTRPIFILTSVLFLVQLLFLGIGLCLGAWAKRAEQASGLATAIILGTFVLKVVIDLKDDYEKIEFLTPFRYFKSIDVMYQHKVAAGYVILCLAVAIATAIGSYYFFQKRDIRA